MEAYLISSGNEHGQAKLLGSIPPPLSNFLALLQKTEPTIFGAPAFLADIILADEELKIFVMNWEAYYKDFVERNFPFSFRSHEMEQATIRMPRKNNYFHRIHEMDSFDKIFQDALSFNKLFIFKSRPLTPMEHTWVSKISEAHVKLLVEIPPTLIPPPEVLDGLIKTGFLKQDSGKIYQTEKTSHFWAFR
jgi:hypothetical protein